jgi:hypothetical protein
MLTPGPAPVIASLAQAGGGGLRFDVFILVGALIVAVVVLSVVVLMVRRKLLAADRAGASAPAGLLESLRRMRDDGRLSEAEFEAAKSRLGAGLRREAQESRPAARRAHPRT